MVRLEQAAVFTEYVFQFFFNLDPYFMLNFDIQINRDGFFRCGHLNFWRAPANQQTHRKYHEGRAFNIHLYMFNLDCLVNLIRYCQRIFYTDLSDVDQAYCLALQYI